ncbi:MAG: aldo/keto reductase [Cyanobacteria bacterium P01_F01_bin.150]
MKTLQFKNGDHMPILGLGTWKSQPGDVYKAVKEAIRVGYRHIDCAHIYGNEAEVGKAIAESISSGIVTRDQLWITSKLWNDCHDPVHVPSGLETTLKNLQLDYLDLYLIHWPVSLRKGAGFPFAADDLITLDQLPIADTWAAMEKLVDAGPCRHIGVSNFSLTKIKDLMGVARIKPEMNQIELHPYLQQTELVQFCQANGIHVTAYSPLGSPDRPDSLKTADEPVLLENETIATIAQEHGVTPAQTLIAWAIHRGTAVIPKSVTPSRIQKNLAAADVSLTEANLKTVEGCDRHRRYVDGTFWCFEGSPYTLDILWDEQ